MDLIGALANVDDLERLAALEAQGRLPDGFAAMAMRHTLAYVKRVAELKLIFAMVPYPGPIVTEE